VSHGRNRQARAKLAGRAHCGSARAMARATPQPARTCAGGVLPRTLTLKTGHRIARAAQRRRGTSAPCNACCEPRGGSADARKLRICARHRASNASTSAHLCGDRNGRPPMERASSGATATSQGASSRATPPSQGAQRSTDRPAPIVTAAPTSNRAPLAAAAVARRSCRWVENRVGQRPLRDAARLRTKRRDPACTTCRGCGLGVRRPDTQAHDDMPPAACCAWRARSSHTEIRTGRTGASLPHRPWPSKCP
jgi:hypothetical protein